MTTIFSTSYDRTPEGGLLFVVATLEHGQVFSMELDAREALDNLQAFANALGLVVTRPL